jgi:hypothetical protein
MPQFNVEDFVPYVNSNEKGVVKKSEYENDYRWFVISKIFSRI